MKNYLLFLLLLPMAGMAQTERITALQNSRNLVVTDGQQTTYNLIKSGERQMIYRRNGQLVVGENAFDEKNAKLRIHSLTRFAIDEDSAAFNSDYAVDHGLLAYRRSMNVGQWNSIVVPFSLNGSQLREAFGEGTLLAGIQGVTDDDIPSLEFQLLDLDGDDIVLEANSHYLIKPTREPDLAENQQTAFVYGPAKVDGPVYVIPNVSLEKKQEPKREALQSESKAVRLRVRGAYTTHDIDVNSTPRYVLDDTGMFSQIAEPVSQKGFRSFVENISKGDNLALRFYIDGIGEDLTDIVQPQWTEGKKRVGVIYDLQGRRIEASQMKKGLYIIDGKKVIVK